MPRYVKVQVIPVPPLVLVQMNQAVVMDHLLVYFTKKRKEHVSYFNPGKGWDKLRFIIVVV